ncbi:hypothetical protein O181_109954 [Austropuccinia psidii MF-1]|uniref:Reverse transcriptase Ty1/copia-type domain-containing protein n=1 Tax=Austropuccinia psidii MF-1 TaxID=1389203 RepID=A0A9Q3JXF0_9BASI|nr:hypothetical protein [Austropuccinia psidii MF-1]
MLGYANQASAYRILRLIDKSVVISRHVKFDESSFPSLAVNTPSVPMEFPYFIFANENKEISLEADTTDLTPNSTPEEDVFHDTLEELPVRIIKVIGPRHPTLITSNISTNNILPFSQRAHTTTREELEGVPRNYNEAIRGKDTEKWQAAIMKELDNMKRLKVWEVVDRKPSDHPITTTCVFKIKRDHNNNITEHKERLCAQGFHQIEGLDYLKTFSPTGKISSLRLLISHAARNNYSFHQMDVKSAFLNAPLEEDITLAIPDGIDEDRGRKALQLHKAIYGLKQAPLAWYNHLANWLKKACFKCSIADPCVFYRIKSKPVWIYVHVDDLAIFGPDLTLFKQEIQNAFDTKDLGKAELLLGVKVNHLPKGFSLSQEHYIDKLAEEYEIKSFTPSNTPLKPNIQLSNATEDELRAFKELKINYRSAIGALNYISLNTRPDITFSVSHLSQFLENPGITHWTVCLQVLRYLYHTKALTLHYTNSGSEGLIGYADADWGNSVMDRRSISGYTITLNGNLISWQTKKQPTVSHSTTEAEYKSLSDMTKEVKWLMRLMKEIGINNTWTPQLLNDNKGAIDLAHSNTNHNGFKTKHMDIKYHYIRDLLKNSIIKLNYISTHLMAADFLTKAVGKTILLRSRSYLNLQYFFFCFIFSALIRCCSQGGLLASKEKRLLTKA